MIEVARIIQRYHWIGIVLLLFISIIWGSTYVVIQKAIATLTPFAFLTIRFAIGSLILLAFSLIRRLKIWQKTQLLAGAFLGTLLFSGFALQTLSLLYTTPSNSGFLSSLTVLIIPIFSFLILRIPIKPIILVNIGIALIGLYLIAFYDLSAINLGDLLALLCAIAFALHVVLNNYFIKKATYFIPFVSIQLGTVSLLSLISVFLFESWETFFQTELLNQVEVYGGILYTALFATALAYFVLTYTQKVFSPTLIGLIVASEPVFSVSFDLIFNNRTLALTTIIGCCFIFFSTLLAISTNKPETNPSTTDQKTGA